MSRWPHLSFLVSVFIANLVFHMSSEKLENAILIGSKSLGHPVFYHKLVIVLSTTNTFPFDMYSHTYDSLWLRKKHPHNVDIFSEEVNHEMKIYI